jgi:glycosyltransferase involved in cell wall biosynthesis
MTEELVSVIVPAFNAEQFIVKALESVRSQTYQSWEIIVINDGGTDNTPGLVTEFKKTTSRSVRLLSHAKNQGLSAARNTGIGASLGSYIALLDADDYWLPKHLEMTCAILKSGNADLAYADAYVFRETPAKEIELLPIETIKITNPATDLFRRNFINPSGAVFTRRLAEKVGEFDRSLRSIEDLDYWIRAAAQGFQIAGTGSQTYYYRKAEDTLSANSARMAESAGKVFEKNRCCCVIPENQIVAKAGDCFFAAGKLYWRKDTVAARRNFYKSWTLNRRRALPLLWYLLTLVLSLARRA